MGALTSEGGMLMIGEVSRRTGVNIETIRYYERTKMLSCPRRTAGGRRVYAPLDVRTLLFVRRGRELGFSLDEIRDLLDLGSTASGPCPALHHPGAQHLREIRSKIRDLKKLERLLGAAVQRGHSDPAAAWSVLDILAPVSGSGGEPHPVGGSVAVQPVGTRPHVPDRKRLKPAGGSDA